MAFEIPDVIQCQVPGSTGRDDDDVCSLHDFPGYYAEDEFWTDI